MYHFAASVLMLPTPGNAMENLACAPSPRKVHDGYFMVSLLPRLPSTHSIVASLYATARLVTRL